MTLLGEVAAGIYSNVAEVCLVVALRDEVAGPNPEQVEIYEKYYDVHHLLYLA